MRAQLLLTDRHDPDLTPIDCMTFFPKAEMWASETGNWAKRYFDIAKLIFEDASHGKDSLAQPPVVRAMFNTLWDATAYTFFFKCEDNGNTYKVMVGTYSGKWEALST